MQGEVLLKLKGNASTKHSGNEVDRNKCRLEIGIGGLYDAVLNQQEPGITGPGGPFQPYFQGVVIIEGFIL